MPSDAERLERVRAVLQGAWAEYRRAAALAADQVEALIRSTGRVVSTNGPSPLARELGALGPAVLDVDRLATILHRTEALPAPPVEALTAAAAVLRELAAEGDMVDVPEGGDPAAAVAQALARLGRAFGAAHVVAVARSGRYDPVTHEPWLRSYPFRRWTRRERRLAPPLILSVAGEDLHAGGLSQYLDGRVKVVLLVRGDAAPPAPLVRAVTPGTFVAQSRDGAELEAFAAWDGPGVLAWVPAAAASFVHDPAGAGRIRLLEVPAEPRRGLGGRSAAQLTEELRQLEAMAASSGPAATATAPAPGAAVAAAAAGAPADPADTLAAWLLRQADLDPVAERP